MTRLARDKYREAEYFLGELWDADDKAIFRYNLDAFISAAYSALHALKIDVSIDAKESAIDEIKDTPLGDFLHEKRNFLIHERPAMVEEEISTLNEKGAGIIVRTPPNKSSIASGPQVSSKPLQKLPEGVISGESIPHRERESHTTQEETSEEVTYHFVDFQDINGKIHEVPDEYTEMPIPDVCEEYLGILDRVLKQYEENGT